MIRFWDFRSEKKCCSSSKRVIPWMSSTCHLLLWRKSLLLWWMFYQRWAARWVVVCFFWSIFVCFSGRTFLPVSACAGVLLCLRWSCGGGFRGCSYRATNLTWRPSGMCAGRTSRSYDGSSSRTGECGGQPGSDAVKCGAWTLLLLLSRWVICCSPVNTL